MASSPSALSLITVADRLRAAGCVFAEEEASLLLSSTQDAAALESMIERRIGGLPLEHILGWAEFCGLRVEVDPGVFVPRPRTEFLVREASELAEPGSIVVDLCCGSGAVGLALADAVDGLELHLADIDPIAVRCARRNVRRLGGRVYEGDLYEPLPAELRGRVDILVAIVPYVPTDEIDLLAREARLHEPLLALDGGVDGLDVLRSVSAAAPTWLAPGGSLLIETSERQASAAAEIFDDAGLAVRIARSQQLDATVAIGERLG